MRAFCIASLAYLFGPLRLVACAIVGQTVPDKVAHSWTGTRSHYELDRWLVSASAAGGFAFVPVVARFVTTRAERPLEPKTLQAHSAVCAFCHEWHSSLVAQFAAVVATGPKNSRRRLDKLHKTLRMSTACTHTVAWSVFALTLCQARQTYANTPRDKTVLLFAHSLWARIE